MQVHSLRLEVVTGGRRQPGPRRPHRARTYRAQCPMPHQASSSWFQPCTLRIQRTALLPQAAAGPRTKKSSAAFMQNQSPAKTARRRQLVDTGLPLCQLSTSAAGLPGGLPGGHRRRTRGMGPTNDCSTDHQAGLERPVAARRRTRGGARERRHRHGQHGGRQPEVRLGLGFGLASPNSTPTPNPTPNQRQPGGAAAPACSCECAPRERHPTPHLGVAQLADSALLGAP